MAKKIKIPKKILIGGITYDIKLVKRFKEDLGEPWGFCNNRGALIELLEFYNGIRFSDSSILNTLLHELLHAIEYVYCDKVSKEQVIVILTEIIYQLLSDNNFYIGEDKFPKSIKILGTRFKIIKNHDFGLNNINTSTCVSVNTNLIKIVSKKHTSSIDIITANLLEVCIQYEASIFLEDVEKINIPGFAAGLYQVLKSTKLDKMIRECNK